MKLKQWQIATISATVFILILLFLVLIFVVIEGKKKENMKIGSVDIPYETFEDIVTTVPSGFVYKICDMRTGECSEFVKGEIEDG